MEISDPRPLPPEVCVSILSFLSVKDISALSRVNLFWRECCENDGVWRDLCCSFNPQLKIKAKEEGISSWKELYKEIAATLTWLPAPPDVPYQILEKKKTVKVTSMDECLVISNLPLLPNRSYYWEIKFYWTDERFERYVGVITKKNAYMNQHKWALPSRMMLPKCTRPQACFSSGDTISLSFCHGQLRILSGVRSFKYESIPMKDDDPIYPYIALYDAGDSATIVRYVSKLTNFAKEAARSSVEFGAPLKLKERNPLMLYNALDGKTFSFEAIRKHVISNFLSKGLEESILLGIDLLEMLQEDLLLPDFDCIEIANGVPLIQIWLLKNKSGRTITLDLFKYQAKMRSNNSIWNNTWFTSVLSSGATFIIAMLMAHK